MKKCKCGTEIREEQTICIECFRKEKNLKWIDYNELIWDVDNRDCGFEAINFTGINLHKEGYKFEIWYAEGQKSPHLHLKCVPHLEALDSKQLKNYKEAIVKKYCPEKYHDYLDLTLCGKHLVAEENKPHFKYKTIKKLCGVWNENNLNFCEKEIYYKVTATKDYKPTVQGSGITAKIIEKISIIDIAKQFGLSIDGHKTLCPFHPDNKTQSLVFYESQGRFHCFGCQVDGNIIKFYAALKELNPKFKYKKNEIK